MARYKQEINEDNVRNIGKQLGIAGSQETDAYNFRTRNGRQLTPEEKTASMGSGRIKWDLPALMQIINEQLQHVGPATLRDIQNQLSLNIPNAPESAYTSMGVAKTPVITSLGQGVRQTPGTGKQTIPTQEVEKGKKQIVLDENERTGGMLSALEGYLNNVLTPKMRDATRSGNLGPTAGAGQFIDDLMNSGSVDGIARFLSDTKKKIQKPLLGGTKEERLMKVAAEQNPELKGKLKTRMMRQQFAGTVMYDPVTKQKFTFNKSGEIVRA